MPRGYEIAWVIDRIKIAPVQPDPARASHDLDERLTSFKGRPDRGEIDLDAAQQVLPPGIAEANPGHWRTLSQEVVNREILILRDDDRAAAPGVVADRVV